MKLALIGLGQAGGKVVEKFMEYDQASRSSTIYSAVVINSTKTDLAGLKSIPREDRILIGETIVKGHGVGADNKMGAMIAKNDLDKIAGAVSKLSTGSIDAFVVISSLGGGTGSGGAPIVTKYLKQKFTEPVYLLGVLPADSEGGVYLLNAARSLKTLAKYADAMILVDNGVFLKAGESMKESYDRINQEIVKRFDVIFRAGELGTGRQVGEMVVDASEIANTINGMEICTIGYSSERIRKGGFLSSSMGILGKKVNEGEERTSRILNVVNNAVKSKLFLPCDYRSVRKALIVVAGAPEELSREGMEKSKAWLESSVIGKEVRGGDYPVPNSEYVSAAVLLAGITGSPKIDSLFERARGMQDIMVQGFSEEEEEKLKKTSMLMQEIEDLTMDDL